MRHGFTTGSCAAAATKAATYMLLSGNVKHSIKIITPGKIEYRADIHEITRNADSVSCAVIKDGGDDPDITSGTLIFATVSYSDTEGIVIDGGKGVGRVTKPGLDQSVGSAAINHVPRQMIENEAREVCSYFDYRGGLNIIISAPEGEEIAKKTFNPKLGIEGGISILGTTGIVEPMSNQAILDTIRVELNQRKALGYNYVIVSPGNYGQEFMKEKYNYDLDKSVKCSNFIGDTIDMARELGFEKMLLVGHIGKLIKVTGGIMNTHSKIADCRMELLSLAAACAGADKALIGEILSAVTTDEAVNILKRKGLLDATMQIVIDRAYMHLSRRAQDQIEMSCIIYSTEQGLLCATRDAESMFGLED